MRNLDMLIPEKKPEGDRWTWATVTDGVPLRIRLDGESAALDIEPENLVGSLSPGDRVWVQVSGRRVIVTGQSDGGFRTGMIQMFYGTTPPPGWLVCDGGTFDAAKYPELSAMLGFGNTLPNFANRFPIGLFDGLTWIGQMGGSQKIDVGNLPAHAHDMSHKHGDGYATGGNHYHTFMFEGYQTTTTGETAWRVSDIDNKTGGGGANFTAATSTEQHSHWVDVPIIYANTGNTGSGGDYWQPFLVVNFIIKT
jgi:microcystin-dependent protein